MQRDKQENIQKCTILSKFDHVAKFFNTSENFWISTWTIITWKKTRTNAYFDGKWNCVVNKVCTTWNLKFRHVSEFTKCDSEIWLWHDKLILWNFNIWCLKIISQNRLKVHIFNANKTNVTTKFKNSIQREIFNLRNYPKNVNCHSKIASCKVKINPPRGPTACGLLFGDDDEAKKSRETGWNSSITCLLC